MDLRLAAMSVRVYALPGIIRRQRCISFIAVSNCCLTYQDSLYQIGLYIFERQLLLYFHEPGP